MKIGRRLSGYGAGKQRVPVSATANPAACTLSMQTANADGRVTASSGDWRRRGHRNDSLARQSTLDATITVTRPKFSTVPASRLVRRHNVCGSLDASVLRAAATLAGQPSARLNVSSSWISAVLVFYRWNNGRTFQRLRLLCSDPRCFALLCFAVVCCALPCSSQRFVVTRRCCR